MSYFATNYYPLTAEYFERGGSYVVDTQQSKRPVIGMHIFKWDPNVSQLKVKTYGGSIVNFHGNSLVEGAIYWVGISEILEITGSPTDTEVHGIISTFKQI